MPTRPLAATAALCPLVAGLLGATAPAGAAAAPITVVATTTQLQDFVRNVGGSRVKVAGLIKPNVDPHEYEPTPGDVTAVAKAKVVVKNGVGLDDWLDRVLKAGGGRARLIVASRGVRLARGADGEADGDPHIWLDPRSAAVMVSDIAAGLAAADPGGAALYRAGATRYRARIRAMDRSLAAEIGTVPAGRRELVTDHDAFGYFARRYGIRVVGAVIPSLSTRAEPSARQLAELVDTIRRERVRVIFAESSVDPRLERAIADEAGARVGPGLFADSLGPPDGPGGTYLKAMAYDMDEVVKAFRAR